MNQARCRSKHERGLTLMEVLIAVLILAFSVTTILGLQSSIVMRALRDKNQRQAMLMARSILAAIEMDPEKVPAQETTKPARELLKNLIPEQKADRDAADGQQLLMATLSAADREFPVPGKELQIVSLKEIRLRVFWGQNPDEQLDVVYYAPRRVEQK